MIVGTNVPSINLFEGGMLEHFDLNQDGVPECISI